MYWKKGQRVVALYDIIITNFLGVQSVRIVKENEIYTIEDLKVGCCMTFLDIGKKNNHRFNKVMYTCDKCKKEYFFKRKEPLMLNEIWFKPLDENESAIARAIKKRISNIFKRKNDPIIYTSTPEETSKNKPLKRKIIEPEPEEEEELV